MRMLPWLLVLAAGAPLVSGVPIAVSCKFLTYGHCHPPHLRAQCLLSSERWGVPGGSACKGSGQQPQKAGQEAGRSPQLRQKGFAGSAHALLQPACRRSKKKRHDSSKENGQAMISGNATLPMCHSPSVNGPKLSAGSPSPRPQKHPEVVAGVPPAVQP